MAPSGRIRTVAGLLLGACLLPACAASGSGEWVGTDLAVDSRLREPEACPADEAVEAYLADWRARRPAEPLVEAGAPMADALCSQRMVVAGLRSTHGDVAGYKVALTHPAAQARFGVDGPVRGVLLEEMLLDDGAVLPADFGARPRFEADLLVVVGDAGVNEAGTPAEVLEHVSAVVPFIELPDLALDADRTIDGSVLTSINVAARYGVLGRRVPAEPTSDFLRALAEMTVRMVDGTSGELEASPGTAVLGHPLNSLLWLAEQGVRLRAGDLVSVGSMGDLYPVEAGREITVTYEGLPDEPSVSVRFR